MSPSNVSDALVRASHRLTPTERRIAEAIIDDPTLLAFGTVSDLADSVGTSRPSIVRFASKLGFSGYPALRDSARAGLSQRLSTPRDRVRAANASSLGDLRSLTDSLAALGSIVASGVLPALAIRIADADAVWIATGETSKASAHALRSGLGIIRPNVHLVEDHSIGRELAGAGAGDIALISDFSRYRRSAVTAAEALSAHSVPIVAITDGPLSPLAASADTLLELSVPAVGPFDSSVPSVALAELIIAEVARVDRESVQVRIDRTEALWATTGTFVAGP
jgi:DNA-binding MurR/RpiR family transcriptional regulator